MDLQHVRALVEHCLQLRIGQRLLRSKSQISQRRRVAGAGLVLLSWILLCWILRSLVLLRLSLLLIRLILAAPCRLLDVWLRG